jgi:hypothetical protein
MSNHPDRAGSRQPIRMRASNCGPGESCGNCKKCQINADIAHRASLPKDHPDYAIDDNDKTGTMGIRDSAELRKNASQLHKGK